MILRRQPRALDFGGCGLLEGGAMRTEILFAFRWQRRATHQRAERTQVNETKSVVPCGLEAQRVQIDAPVRCGRHRNHTRACSILLNAMLDTSPSSNQNTALLTAEATRN